MTEKLYIARVVVETVVSEPLPELAVKGMQEDMDAGLPAGCEFVEIGKLDQLPYGWDGGCIPWGGDGERTCKELLED